MAKYRKRPVVIEAYQFNGSVQDLAAFRHWMEGGSFIRPALAREGSLKLEIQTLEGAICASPGDYVIKGIAGEFYPCRGDIFNETYEMIEP